MMIYVYADGSAILVDASSPHQLVIGGQKVVEILEPTQENLAKYFPNLPSDEDKAVIVQ